MAFLYLSGNGNYGTAGNWQTAGTVPTDEDHAIIPKSLTNDVTGTADAFTSKALDLLYTAPGYAGEFGSSATPMASAAVVVKFFGSGGHYFNCDDDGGSTLKCEFMYIALGLAKSICEIGADSAEPGNIDKIWCMRGDITLKSSIVFGTGFVRVGYVTDRASDCKVEIGASAPALPVLQVFGGQCTANNAVTLAYVAGGTLTVTTAVATTVYIGPGGVVNWDIASPSSGSVTIHVAAGGVLDLMRTSVPKFIANVFVEPGGRIAYDQDVHTFDGSSGLVDLRNQSVA